MKKNLVTIDDLTREDIERILELSGRVKSSPDSYSSDLKRKSLGLVFQKPSNRTRVSFEVGMAQLGGHAVYLGPDEIQLGRRETIRDIARTLSRYLDGIAARTFAHKDVAELARYASVPVINALCDLHHPCQALADILTIKEKLGKLKGVRLAYIGDGNNVLHSLMDACSKTGVSVSYAVPQGYEPDSKITAGAIKNAKRYGAKITRAKTPGEAVRGAQVIYTDVWTSMGQESEREERLKAFQGFQINRKLLKKAKPGCLFMHCLPAHRGEEVTDDVIEGPSSIVFDQAENRLHAQKALLILLLKNS